MSSQTKRKIESVETSLAIVEFLRANGPSRISQVAQSIDRSMSTTHVHLQTLLEHDYVVQENEHYALGLAFLRDGGQRRQRLNIYRAGKTEVRQLAEETKEAAHLAVEQGGRRVILYKTETGDAVYDNTPTGEFTQMHWTATGKAILSQLPYDRITEIIEAHGLPKATDHTITTQERLLDHLDDINDCGYAVEREERRSGVVAVAVPIMDTASHEVVAAVSVSGPRQRILTPDGEIEPVIIESLRNRANVIELRYNHY